VFPRRGRPSAANCACKGLQGLHFSAAANVGRWFHHMQVMFEG
jgi:hypothetical protein